MPDCEVVLVSIFESNSAFSAGGGVQGPKFRNFWKPGFSWANEYKDLLKNVFGKNIKVHLFSPANIWKLSHDVDETRVLMTKLRSLERGCSCNLQIVDDVAKIHTDWRFQSSIWMRSKVEFHILPQTNVATFL